MVLVKVYSVLDEVVVEVTCWHGSGAASHLLLREHLRGERCESMAAVLEGAADTLSFAARMTCEGQTDVDRGCADVL